MKLRGMRICFLCMRRIRVGKSSRLGFAWGRIRYIQSRRFIRISSRLAGRSFIIVCRLLRIRLSRTTT